MKKYQILLHLGALFPLAWLLWDFARDDLTANPIQAVTVRTGKAALVLLVLTLAATPVHTLFRFKPALKFRRTLGLYTFFYASLHFLIFVGLDYGFNPALIYEAIFEKRYALVGFAAALILLPLAITSTRGWMRRLGKNWKRLHRLIYLAGILVIIHYVWLVKTDIREPLVYGAVVILLLIARVPVVRKYLSNLRDKIKSKLPQRKDYKLEAKQGESLP